MRPWEASSGAICYTARPAVPNPLTSGLGPILRLLNEPAREEVVEVYLQRGCDAAMDATGLKIMGQGGDPNAVDPNSTDTVDNLAQDQRPPGLAEFLDALVACRELGIRPNDDLWKRVERLVWKKNRL
jgi:hypothetical protein